MTTNDLYLSINAIIAEINALQNEYSRLSQDDEPQESKILIHRQIKKLRTEVDKKISILINMNPFGENRLTANIKEDINH